MLIPKHNNAAAMKQAYELLSTRLALFIQDADKVAEWFNVVSWTMTAFNLPLESSALREKIVSFFKDDPVVLKEYAAVLDFLTENYQEIDHSLLLHNLRNH